MAFIDRIGVDFGRRRRRGGCADRRGARGPLHRLPDGHRPQRARELRCGPVRGGARGLRRYMASTSACTRSRRSTSPRSRRSCSDAVDRYLEAYVDLAARLQAAWVVIHAGYHFTADKELRMAAALERIGGRPPVRSAEACSSCST